MDNHAVFESTTRDIAARTDVAVSVIQFTFHFLVTFERLNLKSGATKEAKGWRRQQMRAA